jgi:predicted ester cyclase
MSTEEINLKVVKSYIEDFWSDGILDNPGEDYFASTFVAHDPHQEDIQGYEQFVRLGEELLKGFTITNSRIENIFASGDRVVAHYIIEGKHTGYLFGLPPTHRDATIEGMGVFRLANGKITEVWGVTDSLETLQQLGLLPQIGSRAVSAV